MSCAGATAAGASLSGISNALGDLLVLGLIVCALMVHARIRKGNSVA